MDNSKLYTWFFGFACGVLFLYIMTQMIGEPKTSDIKPIDGNPQMVVTNDTIVSGKLYSIDAVSLRYKVSKKSYVDGKKLNMEMREETQKHTVDWLYHFGMDSLKFNGCEIIQIEFEEDYYEYIANQIKARADLEKAKQMVEFAKIQAEINKQMVDHMVDSVNNAKKVTQ